MEHEFEQPECLGEDNGNAWEKTMEHEIDRRSMKSIAKFSIGSKSVAKFSIGRRQWSMNSIAIFKIGSNF